MTETTAKLPRPPSGLKQAGRALWRGIVADFDLRADERAVLEAACRTADDLARLTAEAENALIFIAGSKEQATLNPLFGECRAQRLALGRLLALLGFEDANAAGAGMARSAAGRKLAMSRWAKRGA